MTLPNAKELAAKRAAYLAEANKFREDVYADAICYAAKWVERFFTDYPTVQEVDLTDFFQKLYPPLNNVERKKLVEEFQGAGWVVDLGCGCVLRLP